MRRSSYSRVFIIRHEPGLDVESLAKALAEGIEDQAANPLLTVDSEKLAEELKEILSTIQ